MIVLSVWVSTVSIHWLDIFIQVSVTWTLVVEQLRTRFGINANVPDEASIFSWCYLSHKLFIFDRSHFCKKMAWQTSWISNLRKNLLLRICWLSGHVRSQFSCLNPHFQGQWMQMCHLKWHQICFNHTKQKNSAVAREYALQSIQLLLQYWSSRSSKFYEFHLIWKSLSHFLLVINNNLGFIL